jgi:Bacterial SH3 domain
VDDSTRAPVPPGGPPVRAAEIRHVPAGGISVFAGPDAAPAPIAELPSGHEVIVVGRRPPWVHIQAGDGLDGWVDGTALAGVAVGAAPIPEAAVVPDAGPFQVSVRQPVVEKRKGSVLVAAGPVLGSIGGVIAILGTALPWVQVFDTPISGVDAFNLPARVLTGWEEAAKGGFELGWVVLVLAGLGALLSMISGGGIVRRILGLVVVILCAVYVLQAQDFLNSSAQGLGTGTNVWNLVDYGVLVTFGGGLVMVFAPTR